MARTEHEFFSKLSMELDSIYEAAKDEHMAMIEADFEDNDAEVLDALGWLTDKWENIISGLYDSAIHYISENGVEYDATHSMANPTDEALGVSNMSQFIDNVQKNRLNRD